MVNKNDLLLFIFILKILIINERDNIHANLKEKEISNRVFYKCLVVSGRCDLYFVSSTPPPIFINEK